MTSSHPIRALRRTLIALMAFAFFLQSAIVFDGVNMLCAGMASLSSIGTLYYCIHSDRFRNAPLSMLMLLGYNISVISGALFIQTLYWRAITFNLEVPIHTFGTIVLVQVIAIGTHIFYTKTPSIQRLRSRISNVWKSAGLLTAPSTTQLWVWGAIGSLANWFVTASRYDPLYYGDIGFKFIQAFIPFSVAPFLIPVATYLFDTNEYRRPTNWLAISLYFMIILLIAIGRNSRAAFATSILTLLLALFVAFLIGRFVINHRHLFIGALFALPLLIGASILSDFATAMVIVRQQRNYVSAEDMVDYTIDVFQNKSLLKQHQDYQRLLLGQRYNEVYIDNVFFSRFIYTKYIDLNIALAKRLDATSRAEVQQNSINNLLAILPTPIMKMIDPHLDKQDLAFSSGDFYNNILYGDGGWYRTGSVLADGFVVLGWFYIPLLIFILIVKFVIFDALTIRINKNRIIISVASVISIVQIFTYGVMEESLAGQVGQVIRSIPQMLLLYMILFYTTSYLRKKT